MSSGIFMSESFNIADAVFKEIDDDLYAALHLGADYMVEQGEANVAILSGDLYLSIRTEWLSEDEFEFIADAPNKYGVEYAPFLEWGTRFMAAQPFFEPAYEAGKEKIQELIDDIARKY